MGDFAGKDGDRLPRRAIPCPRGRFSASTLRRRGPVIGLDQAAQLDRERLAAPIHGLADRDSDPPLADAVFFDGGLLDAIEAYADASLENRRVVVRAVRVVREAVGWGLGHQSHQISLQAG